MSYVYPTVSDFKTHFFRDFPYGTDVNTSVLDQDITKAMTEADAHFNTGLFDGQDTFFLAYLYLTAHYLVMDLRAASQGIAGSFSWLENSKSVGSVSAGFSTPQSISESPTLAMYSKTNYGAKYLALVLPYLVGNTFCVQGATQP